MSRRTILLREVVHHHAFRLRPPLERLPQEGRLNWKRCRCPKWINGTLDCQLIRRTANTRSWEKAEDLRRDWEEADSPKKIEPVTIEEAVEAYLTDAKARELREATLYKLEIIFRKQFLA